MIRVAFILTLIYLSVSCAPCREVVMSTQRDSTSVEVRVRNITLRDTVQVEIPTISERVIIKSDTSYLSNPYASSEAIIMPDGELYHTLESTPQTLQKGHEFRAEVRDSVIYHDRTEIKIVEVERELTWWQGLQIRGFWALLSLIVGVVVVRRVLL